MDIPKLGNTFRSIDKCIAWLWESLINGTITPSVAREAKGVIGMKLESKKTRHAQNELEDAREVLRKIEKAKQLTEVSREHVVAPETGDLDA